MPLEPDSRHDARALRELLHVLAELKSPVIYYPDLNECRGPAREYYTVFFMSFHGPKAHGDRPDKLV
jgi:hypothetical protein